MAKLHIANLVEISHWIVSDSSEADQGYWSVQNRFQNANIEKNVRFENRQYGFLSFIYEGATRTRTGDNIEAGLILSTNPISMDYGYDIVVLDYNENQHHIKRQIKVRTCLMDDNFENVQKVLTTEAWIGASMNYDAETLEITLASAVDAVFAGMPNMFLTETLVGRLPSTARVRTS
jgi:hypothetical protein